MARTPRSSVPKTSGSGVSRLSYQKGYSLGNRGTSSGGGSPSVANAAAEAQRSPRGRKPDLGGGDGKLNIAFNDVQQVENLGDVQNYAKGAPPRDRYAKSGKATGKLSSSKELPSGWKR